MTREDAINLMKVIVHMLEEKYDTDRVEDAVDMAINALEQEPCEDAISRQAVLDAIMANNIWENEYNLTSSRIKKAVENLPSVNPQEPFKPMVEIDLYSVIKQKYIERDVLDKIRAEIFNACSDNYHMPVYKLSCDEIFEIIDKYKAESEEISDTNLKMWEGIFKAESEEKNADSN